MRYFITFGPVKANETGLVEYGMERRELVLDSSYSDKVGFSEFDYLDSKTKEVSLEKFIGVLYQARKYNKALDDYLNSTLGFQKINKVTGKLIYTSYQQKNGRLLVNNYLETWNGSAGEIMEFANVVYNERFDNNFTPNQLEDADFVLIKTKFSFGTVVRAFPVVGCRINQNGQHDGIWIKLINESLKDEFGQEIDMIRTMTRIERP